MTQRMLPLYEGKMLHHYDHRWATYVGDITRDTTDIDKSDPSLSAIPRYWVREEVVADRLPSSARDWLIGVRDITNSTNERTVISGGFPRAAVGNNLPLVLGASVSAELLVAALSSFALDYLARMKVGGTHLNFFIAQQLPLPIPNRFSNFHPWAAGEVGTWMQSRVLELTYTADDMRPFAADLGDTGEPFVWDPERRFLLRCELDAAFFHLYGVARNDVEYIMDTFPIVKGKDVAAHGEFRTKRVILEVFDAMQRAIDTGKPYRTILDPPPGECPRHRSTDASDGRFNRLDSADRGGRP